MGICSEFVQFIQNPLPAGPTKECPVRQCPGIEYVECPVICINSWLSEIILILFVFSLLIGGNALELEKNAQSAN